MLVEGMSDELSEDGESGGSAREVPLEDMGITMTTVG